MTKTRTTQRKMASTRASLSDMINNLPDAVIETILMKLPTRDAVRTSILSRKWRYRWLELPQFVFDRTLWDALVVEHSAMIMFEMILNQFMSNHRGPVLKFILSVPDLDICPEIDHLITFLSRNNIEDLTIEMWKDCYLLPSSIFTCQQLKHLTLKNCQICSAVALKGFSKLTSLKLTCCHISGEGLSILISESPLLELLELLFCFATDLYIDAPNLRTFSFDGFAKSIIIKTAPLLVSVSIMFCGHASRKIGCSFAKHLHGLPAVESLCLNYRTIQESFAVSDLEDYATLVHLKHLKLESISFNDVLSLQFLLRLMRNSANLKSIAIQFVDKKYVQAKASTKYLEDEDNSYLQLSELKEVKLSYINGTKPELEFIKLLLAKSPTLKKLRIKPTEYASIDYRYEIVTEVTKFQRASKEAQVFYG